MRWRAATWRSSRRRRERPATSSRCKLDLEGLPVVVSDTAGIREGAGAVEQEGIRRTLARAQAADLVLWLVDAMALDAPAPPGRPCVRTGCWWW